ncbi:MAG: hypothetical protein JNM22_06445 [Saprospiraceae bacterium]|nr:hypothetical protein [Saprospiraceae bacterium]
MKFLKVFSLALLTLFVAAQSASAQAAAATKPVAQPAVMHNTAQKTATTAKPAATSQPQAKPAANEKSTQPGEHAKAANAKSATHKTHRKHKAKKTTGAATSTTEMKGKSHHDAAGDKKAAKPEKQ